jgi:hypothetical protein
MGSLTSRPKAASAPVSAPQVVYVPAVSSTNSSPVSSPDPEVDEAATAMQRAENVLRRSRSRLGTVLTSFRGILTPSDVGTQRKNLLGE